MLDLEEAAEPRSQFGKTAITTRREWRPRGFGFTETGPELTPRGPQPAAGTWGHKLSLVAQLVMKQTAVWASSPSK